MLQLAVRPYRRPFCPPLHTHHGRWTHREGLVVRLKTHQGQVGFGEIAPLPQFGTETLAAAQELCAQWPTQFEPTAIAAIPEGLPACQFGFASALAALSAPCRAPVASPPALLCGLLPTGAAALQAWPGLWRQGYRTFKWKIGVAPLPDELAIFQALVAQLPPTARLRLDANGGLTPATGEHWLGACDAATDTVEFLEQPLPPDHGLSWVLDQVHRVQTAIALDESVATIPHLQRVSQHLQQRVVYVIKPAIAGFPEQLYHLCIRHQLDVVVSSALETSVGRQACLAQAEALWQAGLPQRALGFGVGHWFKDEWDSLSQETLWQQL